MRASTLLAFDFGLKRIGVAVGQTQTRSANPLKTLAVKREHPDWQAIAELIEIWAPDALVVGLPLNMDGTEQEMTLRAKRFGRQLQGRFRLPVHLVDERLSTREAKDRLQDQGRIADSADAVAAQVILEGWFSGIRPPGDEQG
ncbi:MAG: Holliday junction resolvase RuvX [Gammaproteobacteria bacterium]|nr:Holliday junction resolvase RuvX [Gammaproteobacteria bacterium]MDH3413644.1 Holliday junction resolvase RuvX [Gammaproteobacteria bacterium]